MSARGDIAMAYPPKPCARCGAKFYKPSTYSLPQWERKAFCSNRCSGIARRTGTVTTDGRIKVWDGDRLRLRSHVVAERKLGRPLRPGEVVDHLDSDPTNDRPSNLAVHPSHAEHMRAHWRDGRLIKAIGSLGTSTSTIRHEWP